MACQTHNFELEWHIGVQFLDFSKFDVWLILFRIYWKVLLPKLKTRNKMSQTFKKIEMIFVMQQFLKSWIYRVCRNCLRTLPAIFDIENIDEYG